MATKIKYIAYVVASIDGRIAKDKNSGVNWTSKEDWNFLQNSLKNSDAVIVGHNTFKKYKDSLEKRNTIVLTSKTENPVEKGSVIFFNPEKNNLKKILTNKKYRNIAILGGSKVYNFCLENKMLKELCVTIEPFVFTTGIPMFESKVFKKYKFSLQSIIKLNKKGTILLKYKYEN